MTGVFTPEGEKFAAAPPVERHRKSKRKQTAPPGDIIPQAPHGRRLRGETLINAKQ